MHRETFAHTAQHGERIKSLHYRPDGALLSASEDGTVRVWAAGLSR